MSEDRKVYLNDWAEPDWEGKSGEAAMLAAFEVGEAALQGAEVLVASYSIDGYDGSAYVLFKRDGQLFEVHGGHCSCYGLEKQWEPEATEAEAIHHRLDKGSWGEEDRIKDAVRAALAVTS